MTRRRSASACRRPPRPGRPRPPLIPRNPARSRRVLTPRPRVLRLRAQGLRVARLRGARPRVLLRRVPPLRDARRRAFRAGVGRPAVRFRGRVRVGDARPAGRLAVVPGADVPAVRHVGEGFGRAHGSRAQTAPGPPANPGKTGAGKTAAGEGPVTMRNTAQKGQSKRTARQAHLTVARVEPWSVMKFSFVVSLVAFVILFVAVSVLYGVLSGLGVFDSLQRVVTSVTSSQGFGGREREGVVLRVQGARLHGPARLAQHRADHRDVRRSARWCTT